MISDSVILGFCQMTDIGKSAGPGIGATTFVFKALELSMENPVYQDMANKFFEHFLTIAQAMSNMGSGNHGLWDDTDEFYYDTVRMPGDVSIKLKIRSMVSSHSAKVGWKWYFTCTQRRATSIS